MHIETKKFEYLENILIFVYHVEQTVSTLHNDILLTDPLRREFIPSRYLLVYLSLIFESYDCYEHKTTFFHILKIVISFQYTKNINQFIIFKLQVRF